MTTFPNRATTKIALEPPLCGGVRRGAVSESHVRDWLASAIVSVLSISLLVQPLVVCIPMLAIGLCQHETCRERLNFVVRHYMPRQLVSAYVKLIRWFQGLCGCDSNFAILILGVLLILSAVLLFTKPFFFGVVLGLVAFIVAPPVRLRLTRSLHENKRPAISEDRLQRLVAVAVKESDKLDSKSERNKRLVVPFIDILGFNPFDRSQVVEGFAIDVPKADTQFDYAILDGDQTLAVVETANPTKAYADQLPTKLKRYLRETGACWGIWTDGKDYAIYKASTPPSGPDVRPAMHFSLLNTDADELARIANLLSSKE